MQADPLSVLTLAMALGTALVAGVFFAFSTLVMPALAQLAPAHAIPAMQSINVAAINQWFMSAFFGTAVGCGLIAASSLSRWHEPDAIYGLLGGSLYLFGAVAVTIAVHVPRNIALARAEANSIDGPRRWARFASEWTAWNHVRAVAALAAAGSLIVALVGGSGA